MRGSTITGSAQGVSITDTVSRGQKILKDRPEARGRERYAGRTNRPAKGNENVARADAEAGTDKAEGRSDGTDDTSREEA
jgi:hypothetical protein